MLQGQEPWKQARMKRETARGTDLAKVQKLVDVEMQVVPGRAQ